jgi:acyl-coenzyme A thioesterase PaaI-like protein
LQIEVDGRRLLNKSLLLRLLNLWPPYLGAGVRVVRMALDRNLIEVEMKLRFWNRNYVGTQFGGSLYSMTDPFYMLILIETLGPDYIVWDKAATIRFKRPGRGRVSARFHVPAERLEQIRRETDDSGKTEQRFDVQVIDDTGQVIAEVEKVLSVRRKDRTGTT